MNQDYVTEINVQSPAVKNAVIRCMDTIKPEAVSWLWPGRIALGKVTMIAGDPGLGKSLIGIFLAGQVSRGARWPVDNTLCPNGSVLLISGEDSPSDAIRPRLDAIRADVSKIYILDCIRDIDKDTDLPIDRDMSLKRDVDSIELKVNEIPDCKLIVIDPISAYLGNADSHNNSEIRGLLKPLADMATRKRVAVVVISHFNKGGQSSAMYRTTGSLAFVAAARAVYAVAKDQDNPDRRLFLPIKNNLGPDNSGLAYSISQTSSNIPLIQWEPDPVSISADDALSQMTDDMRSEREEAREWLCDLLENNGGGMLAEDIEKERRKDGPSQATLRRARGDLRKDGVIDKSKSFGNGKWRWYLSAASDQEALPPKREHLEQHDQTVETQGNEQLAQLAQEQQAELKAILGNILGEMGRPLTVEAVIGELVPDDYQSLVDDPEFTRNYITKTLLPRLSA